MTHTVDTVLSTVYCLHMTIIEIHNHRLPYNLYCVGGDVKHCSIQSNEIHKWCYDLLSLVCKECIGWGLFLGNL